MNALIGWGIVVAGLVVLWLADVAIEERARKADEQALLDALEVARSSARKGGAA